MKIEYQTKGFALVMIMLFFILISASTVLLENKIYTEINLTRNYYRYFRAKRNIDLLCDRIETILLQNKTLNNYCDKQGCYSVLNVASDNSLIKVIKLAISGVYEDSNVLVNVVYRISHPFNNSANLKIEKIFLQEAS